MAELEQRPYGFRARIVFRHEFDQIVPAGMSLVAASLINPAAAAK